MTLDVLPSLPSSSSARCSFPIRTHRPTSLAFEDLIPYEHSNLPLPERIDSLVRLLLTETESELSYINLQLQHVQSELRDFCQQRAKKGKQRRQGWQITGASGPVGPLIELQMNGQVKPIEDLDTWIRLSQREFDKLCKEHRRKIAEVEGLKRAIAAHKRLPNEILAQIFLWCIEGFRRFTVIVPPCRGGRLPWNLAHVCARWRSVALGEPRLWNNIFVSDHRKMDDLFGMIDNILQWSGNTPLTLEYAKSETSSSSLPYAGVIDIFVPHASRIKALKLDSDAETIEQFLNLPSGLLETLEDLSLEWRAPPHDNLILPPTSGIEVFHYAHALRKLRLRASRGFLLPLDFFSNLGVPWSLLTHLDLSHLSVALPVAQWVLRSCPSLIECGIRIRSETATNTLIPDGSSGPIVLPHLSVLNLCGRKYGILSQHIIPNLATPSLSSFTIHTETVPTFGTADEILGMMARARLPASAGETDVAPSQSLTHLEIVNVYPSQLSTILATFPSLTYLSAPTAFLGQTALEEMTEGRLGINLEKLLCRVTTANLDAVLDLLRARWFHSSESELDTATGHGHTGKLSVLMIVTDHALNPPTVDNKKLYGYRKRLREMQDSGGIGWEMADFVGFEEFVHGYPRYRGDG